MNPKVVETPASALTLQEVKSHLRIESADDDALLQIYMAAAQGAIDGPGKWLGISIGKQLLELTAPVPDPCLWPGIALPYRPVIDIVSIKYGVAQRIVDQANYMLTPDAVLRPISSTEWPWSDDESGTVSFRYHAGTDVVPAPIKAALLIMIADLYGTRDLKMAGTLTENPTVLRLLAPFQVWA